MSNIKKGYKVLNVALFGSLVGGVMGLLFAPKSGHELRQDLLGQANKIEDKAVEIRDKAQNVWLNVEDKTQITVNTGKSWLQKGRRLLSNLKTMISEIQQGALTKTDLINASEVLQNKSNANSTKEI